jgi:hypothetical protein
MKKRFHKISIDEFVKIITNNNSIIKAEDLKRDLIEFKERKVNGEICDCGNPIWIVGSALTGKGCFTCITGESECSGDYEIE